MDGHEAPVGRAGGLVIAAGIHRPRRPGTSRWRARRACPSRCLSLRWPP